MTSQDRLGLRTEAPRLEPDEAFLQRLSQLAAAGAPAAPSPPVARSGLAIGLAAASVAAVVGGVAWAGGVIGDSDPSPRPPAPADTGGAETEAPSPDATGDPTPLTPGGREDTGDQDEDQPAGDWGLHHEHRGGAQQHQDQGQDPATTDAPGTDQGQDDDSQGDQGDQGDQGGDKPGKGPGTHPGNPNPGSPPSAHPGNPSPGTPQGIGNPDSAQDDDQGGDLGEDGNQDQD